MACQLEGRLLPIRVRLKISCKESGSTTWAHQQIRNFKVSADSGSSAGSEETIIRLVVLGSIGRCRCYLIDW